MAIDMNRFWEDTPLTARRPGVTRAQIAAWEKQRGVKLPELLCDALMRQNAGVVRYSDVHVLPLEAIEPPDADFFGWVASDDVAPNRNLLLTFAYGDEEPMYLLNYNTRGPQAEPSVHHVYHDPGDMNDEADTVEAFFARLLDVTETPTVDWSETARLEVVLFQETVPYSPTIHIEQVLGRHNGALVLFTHEAPDEILTKTTIPEPLSTSLDGIWPMLRSVYMVQLEPKDPSGIVAIESTRTSDGLWKNQTDHGVPVYVTVESTSKAKLQALRETLIGKAAVAKEDRYAWWWTWVVTPLAIMLLLPLVLPVLIVLWILRLIYRLLELTPPPPNTNG